MGSFVDSMILRGVQPALRQRRLAPGSGSLSVWAGLCREQPSGERELRPLGRGQIPACAGDDDGVQLVADERDARRVRCFDRDAEILSASPVRGEDLHFCTSPDGDPQVAVGIDSQAVRVTASAEEDELFSGTNIGGSVPASVHPLRDRIHGVEVRAIGRPPEPVGEPEILIEHGQRGIGFEPNQPIRRPSGFVQGEASNDEAPLWIHGPIVEAVTLGGVAPRCV